MDRPSSPHFYPKPELDAEQSRQEMEGEPERQELAANLAKHELGDTNEQCNRTEVLSPSVSQELRGIEPSHAMDS